jgi:hypothetical protein
MILPVMFRQHITGDWEEVFERLFAALTKAVTAGNIHMESWKATLNNSYRNLLK